VYLVLGAPVAVFGWDGDGTKPVNSDTEHGVDGRQTDSIVD